VHVPAAAGAQVFNAPPRVDAHLVKLALDAGADYPVIAKMALIPEIIIEPGLAGRIVSLPATLARKGQNGAHGLLIR
jgi:hypothetical protein